MRKLRSSKGETLAETLVAILIIALSAAFLCAMAANASKMIRNTDKAVAEVCEDISAAEKKSGSIDNATVKIGEEEVGVKLYKNDKNDKNGGIVSYEADDSQSTTEPTANTGEGQSEETSGEGTQ